MEFIQVVQKKLTNATLCVQKSANGFLKKSAKAQPLKNPPVNIQGS
jgi:hypothetical protein